MALAHRLHELDQLTEWCYRSVCVNLSRQGYRSAEPNGIRRETSQVLAKVFAALRADGITPAEVARDLSLDVAELNTYVFGLIPTAIRGGADGSPAKRPTLTVIKN
jgi:hypothetical protein